MLAHGVPVSDWNDAPGTAGTPAPAQFRTIDDVAALLRADFAANAIDAVVEANEWDPEYHRGAARVVVGYSDFSFASPSGAEGPGANTPIPDGSGDVGRPILDDLSTFHVWIHDPGGGSGEGVAESARTATKALLQQTMRAIREGIAAPFREPPRGKWPKPQEMPPGYPAFTYGSFVEVDVMLPSPILGDRLHVAGLAGGIQIEDSVIIDGAPAVASGTSTAGQPS